MTVLTAPHTALRTPETALLGEAGALLTIDLGAIRRNYRQLKTLAAPAECAAVIKADAYGCGIEAVAPALYKDGCRTFFVALADEGRRVRAAVPDPDVRVFVLNGLPAAAATELAEARLSPVLGSVDEIAEWVAFSAEHQTAPRPALHVDTGMSRLGVSVDEINDHRVRDQAVAAQPHLLMTHLACADAPDHPLNARQRAAFAGVRALLPGLATSLTNSAGTILGWAKDTTLARPGVALFGGLAVSDRPNPMEPVVRLDARVIQTRTVTPGETVGYGATWAAQRPTRLALLSVGYADGYHRLAASNGAMAAIGGARVPLAGRVSMDLIAVDVTDLPETFVHRDTLVELIGPTITVDDVAGWAETIGYEVLTGLGPRYRRRIIDSEAG